MNDDKFLRENNARHMWDLMVHPGDTRANPPRIVTDASGIRITDFYGHEGIDAVGGLRNVNRAYFFRPMKDAIAAQLDALPYYSAFQGTTNDDAIGICRACVPVTVFIYSAFRLKADGLFHPRAE